MPDVRLPSAWERTSLAGLADYVNGFAFNESYWSAEGLPIVRIAQITGSQGIVDRYQGPLPDTYRLDDGDLIFSWSGTLAVVRWNGGPAWLNQHLFKVVPRHGVDRNLLFHLLQASVAEMDKRTHGSTMKHIKRGELRDFGVSLPLDPTEQRALAEILDTLDTTIRQTEAIIEKLKQVKQGLLHDLLTRGIDANGELRPPQSQAPHLYKDSALGWIPREWSATSIASLATYIGSGVTPTGGSEVYVDSGVLFIRSQNVHFNGLRLDDAAYIDKHTHAGMARSELCLYDVLLNITGASIGRCCIFPDGMGAANVNQHVCAIRLERSGRPQAAFLSSFLGSSFGQSQIDRFNAGGSREGLNYQQVRSIVVSWPPEAEAERIVSTTSALDGRIALEANEAEKCKALKAGLMDDLLTSRVRVIPLLAAATHA